MTRLPRPCLGYTDPDTGRVVPCGVPAVGGRCPACAARHDASRRPGPDARGYDAAYRADRAVLLAPDADGRPPECALRLPGCTRWATTADHVVPVLGGRVRSRLLQPACASCNRKRGARPIDVAIGGVEAREREAEALAELAERYADARERALGSDDDPWWPDP